MSNISVVARRALMLLTLAAGVAALMALWRSPSARDTPSSPPQWPPFEPVAAGATPPAVPSPDASPLPWRLARPDEPEAPLGFPVKVKVASGIYHTPGGRFYDRTRPDRWYATAEAAQADGYRRSKT